MTTQTKDLQQTEATKTVRDLLEKSKKQIAAALPRHMSADRMLRIAMTAVQKTPQLLNCHPVTLIGAVIQSAQLGLEPNDGTGQAWLIPFRNGKKNRMEVQFIPGYRGLMRLVRNSGQIRRFEARAVHAGDKFSYSFGLDPKLEHTPEPGDGETQRALTFVYAVAEFDNGSKQFDVMSIEEIEKIRKRSRAGDGGPWKTDYDEMGKKSIIRRISKQLPVSTEAQKAIALDERAEIGLPQDLGTVFDPGEAATSEGETGGDVPDPKPADNGAGDTEGLSTAVIEVDKVLATTFGEDDREGFKIFAKGDKEFFIAWEKSIANAAKNAKKEGRKVKIQFDGTELGREIQLIESAG